MAACGFGNPGLDHGLAQGLLRGVLVDVMAAFDRVGTGFLAGVETESGRGEDELPAELAFRAGILLAERRREPDAAVPGLHVGPMDFLDAADLGAEACHEPPGERDNPVLVALAFADDDLAACEVDILDPQPAGLEQSEAGSVHQLGHQPLDSDHSV
jgi:hypothetical protein